MRTLMPWPGLTRRRISFEPRCPIGYPASSERNRCRRCT